MSGISQLVEHQTPPPTPNRWNTQMETDPHFDSFPGALDSDSFPLHATELACTEKQLAHSM